MSEKKTESKFKSPIDKRDFLMLTGLGLLGFGCYLVYPPAAFISPGLILVGISVFGVKG